MERHDMINTVGREFLTSNIEAGEFSYVSALGGKGNLAAPNHWKVDLRFYDKNSQVVVLIETKQFFSSKDESQLFDYIQNELKFAPKNKIIAILANTKNNKIKVFRVDKNLNMICLDEDKKLKSMKEYVSYFNKIYKNDRTAVLDSTSQLNRMLHDNGVPEKLRSQLVGTCMLALKQGLLFENLSSAMIIAGIREKLTNLLSKNGDDSAKERKIQLLDTKVLNDQNVKNITDENFQKLLTYIHDNILPYIDSESNEGQDILSYFFTTFNKYVARDDKNQAFTPYHIAEFMTTIGDVSKNTKVLDPTAGSGTFLVQALVQALSKCQTDDERNQVKRHNIFGVEFDENVFGLATTNMLIHGDGNTNIICGSCFEQSDFIKKAKIDLILMNPPYNASKAQVPSHIANLFGKSTTDPTKGLSFVHFVADCCKEQKGKLITLLPMQCAIGTRGEILNFKEKMLEEHTLDAVFSFPDEIFYPGASAIACCMVFDLNRPHDNSKETFFGYYKDDGFEKRKGVGRIDVKDKWDDIRKEWLDLYNHKTSKAGYSVCKHVTAEDEWCAEAYMETDYNTLSEEDFINSMREYASFLIKNQDYED